MFWENAHVIAVLIGMLALLVGSQVKPELNPLLVLLLGLVPGTIVWVARTLWKPRPVARSDDVDATLDRYKSSAPVVDEMYQSKVLHVWYVFAVAAALGLVATFVYRGVFEIQERLARASVIPGLFVVGSAVVAEWALRRPLLNVPIRPLFGFLGALVVLTLGVILYLLPEVFSPEGRALAGALLGCGLGVCFAVWLRNVG
jgi:4-amino-4-deoxy-L-arabinose transferase-like glycosyltransferase